MEASAAEVPSPQYRPLARRAWLAQRWIGFTGVLALVVLGLNVAYLSALGNPDEATALEGLVSVSYLAQLAIHVLGAGIFIAWFFRAYSNIRAFGVPFLRHDRGWAIFAWFVPIVSLFWPKRMANDAWRAAEPGAPANDRNWLERRVSPLLDFWWVAWLGANFADNAAARIDSDAVAQTRPATVAAIVAQVLYVIAAVLCILVIRSLTARQEARALAEVQVLALSEDERAEAAQAARHGHDGLGRRIAWYFAGTALLLLSVAAGASADDQPASVQLGIAIGCLVISLLVGVVVVQLIGRLAKRRPARWSGWAALAAVIVAVAAASGQAAMNSNTTPRPTASTTPSPADLAAACPDHPYRPGRLPAGYRYSKATAKERRGILGGMGLTPAGKRRTTTVYVMRRGRTVALVLAVPSGGRPDDFLNGYLDESRKKWGKKAHVRQISAGGTAAASLVTTPEDAAAIASDTCVSVAVLGVDPRVMRRLIGPVVRMG